MDQLQRSFGFCNVDDIALHLDSTSQPTFSISSRNREPILDFGETATINKSRRNIDPLQIPNQSYHTFHMDIVFGTNTAIGGIRYELFIVDRGTRMKYTYALHSLENDLLPSLKTFIKDIGCKPKMICTDFDHKLCGEKVLSYFTNPETGTYIIYTAPPRHQDKNGLTERHWQTILRMSRG